jgi:hypothetical protein
MPTSGPGVQALLQTTALLIQDGSQHHVRDLHGKRQNETEEEQVSEVSAEIRYTCSEGSEQRTAHGDVPTVALVNVLEISTFRPGPALSMLHVDKFQLGLLESKLICGKGMQLGSLAEFLESTVLLPYTA